MTRAGRSLFYFGIYVFLLGALFVAIPEKVMITAKLPSIPAGWARVVGLLAMIIASCDIICGKNNITVMIHASIYIRLCFVMGIVLLVVFGQMPLQTLLFAVPDALGAFWTAVAIKPESANRKA